VIEIFELLFSKMWDWLAALCALSILTGFAYFLAFGLGQWLNFSVDIQNEDRED
jgi:hypothetical protein